MPHLILGHGQTTGWIPREDSAKPIPDSLGTKPVYKKRADPEDDTKEILAMAVLECVEDKQGTGRIPITMKQAKSLEAICPGRKDIAYEEKPVPPADPKDGTIEKPLEDTQPSESSFPDNTEDPPDEFGD